MNKRSLRIAGWAIGLSLAFGAIGTAVGASRGSSPEELFAEDSTSSFSWSGSTGTADTSKKTISWTNGIGVCSSISHDGSRNSSFNNSTTAPRLYANTTTRFNFIDNIFVKSIVFTVSDSKHGGTAASSCSIGTYSYSSLTWANANNADSSSPTSYVSITWGGQIRPTSATITYVDLSATTASVVSVSASVGERTYYAGTKLTASDFALDVLWDDEETTHPASGFTWTVNNVADGNLGDGDNTVVVTYQEVNSNEIIVKAIAAHTTAVSLQNTGTVKVGQNIQLVASLTPAESIDPVVWESEDEAIATVDEDGLVTGVSEGIVNIIATSNNIAATCEVSVQDGALKNGGQYILASEGSYTASSVTYNYKMEFNGVSSSLGLDSAYTFKPACTKLLTAEKGTGDDEYYLSFDDGGSTAYLIYGDKKLNTSSTKVADGVWIVSFSGGNAIIQNKAHSTYKLQYNPNGGSGRFAAYSSNQKTVTLTRYDDTAKAGEFTEKYMHVEVATSVSGTGLCKTSGWYTTAEGYFNALPLGARRAFLNESAFANYSARLLNWADANGKKIGNDGKGNDDVLVAKANSLSGKTPLAKQNNSVLIATVVAVGLVAAGGLVFLHHRHRKED
jgi:hypothetical protein